MKRLRRIRIVLVLVVVLVLGCLSFAAFHDREPRYQGRTLSEWVETQWIEVGATNSETHPAEYEVRDAMKHMAPEAIPILLKWAEKKDSGLKRRVIGFLGKHPVIPFKFKSDEEYHLMAMGGFGLLGSEAKPAWPTLIQWTFSPDADRRNAALDCLDASKADKEIILPVLVRLLHDPDKSIQKAAAFYFNYDYPQDAEVAGVYKMFPRTREMPTRNKNTNQPQINK